MEKYFVTIICFFLSALSYAGERGSSCLNDNEKMDSHISVKSQSINWDDNSPAPFKPSISNFVNNEFKKLKKDNFMHFDSLKKYRKYKKFQDQERADILHYKIDPNVDAEMPRMALDPNVDAKILKVYPHVGMGLLGIKKCPHVKHPEFYFKK